MNEDSNKDSGKNEVAFLADHVKIKIKDNWKSYAVSAMIYLPLVLGMVAYLLSYALLVSFQFMPADTGESGGLFAYIFFCLCLYFIGLVLCLISAAAKKSVKMMLIVLLVPLIIYLMTIYACYCAGKHENADSNKIEFNRPNN
jgi:hypothetical protein